MRTAARSRPPRCRGNGHEARCLIMSAPVLLRPATGQDAESIRSLLERCDLPTQDLGRSEPDFTVACDGPLLVGVGGIERFGATGLLRSVAVSPQHRGMGIGQTLVADLERRAFTGGVTQLVLLTQTAQAFFEHLGYRVIERAGAPAPVQQSEEFRALCPQSACCMAKSL